MQSGGVQERPQPPSHNIFEEYLAKAKDKKVGKKVGVKVVEVEGQNTNNPAAAPDQTQSQTQPISRSEYATLQASLKLLTERQMQAADTQLCFMKVYSPTDGSMISHISVQEKDE